MGLHAYGKRSALQRYVVERIVPAIVDEASWKKAQKTLHDNMIFGVRGARNKYVLRGLIKCEMCGLT
jgi:site-specific DNA recombinase